jgi:dTMP kinase
MKPGFIVFEGLDGSGTSTQAALLEQFLSSKGHRVLSTCEPSPGPIGNQIRQAFKGRLLFQADAVGFDRQMAYLFAADRFDHLHNDVDGVLPMMSRGYAVVCTRYYFSSFAYHCTTEADWELVARLNAAFPPPDLLVYLRNPVDESVRRLEKRSHLDSYEKPEKLALVAKNYERVIGEFTGNVLVLDATRAAADIHADICAAVSAGAA